MTLIARIERRLRRILAAPDRSWTGAPRSKQPVDADFDVEFYRDFHADLQQMHGDALAAHYMKFGKSEGRAPNAETFYARLQAEHGDLPPRFDPQVYRLMHDDLRTALRNDYDAARHYLLAGRREKRDYIHFDADLYRSLYFSGTVITDYELGLHYKSVGREEGRIGSWRQFIAERGVRHGAWVDALRPDEFALLNWSWCGPIATKLDAVDVMLREGMARLAPIAFDFRFDPLYYREVHPEYDGLDDEAIYRRWLFDDLNQNWPASPEQHLRGLGLMISEYPAGFDWKAYLAHRFEGRGNRWFALEEFLRAGFQAERRAFARGDRAGEFLVALGDFYRGRDDGLAIAALEEARIRAGDDYSISHHLGDAYFRLGRWREALVRFQYAAAFAEADLWTFVNGARAALQLGAFRRAMELLQAGRPTIGGDPRFRDTVRDLVEAFFHARVRRVRGLYALPEGRARADARVAALVARVAELWATLDPIGAPIPASGDGRVVMLASLDIRVCTHYRVEQKRELFERLDRPFQVFGLHEFDAFMAALPGATAAIFFRLPAWPSVVRGMTAAAAMQVPSYYEIDDLIFDAEHYPDTLESYGGLLSAESYASLLFGVPLFRAAIELCDYAIASTSPLARAVEPLVKSRRVFWLPNGLDSRNEPYLQTPPARLRRDDTVVIAYASGTTAHNSDFHELAGPALVGVLKARPNARLLLVGYLALTEDFDEVRDQIIRFDFVDGAMAFWSLLADADLNLAVLKSTWATDSKSEIKWLEAAAMAIPSIVSDTAMYREVLDDGVDALIVDAPEAWEAALMRMIDDAELRREIGRAAQAKAARNYSLAANAKRVESLLEPALERRRQEAARARLPRARRKIRVLLVNVWFPPQTIGGATRVLRNNLDTWLDSEAAQEFEFAVVCTDHDARPAFRRRIDDYRGVAVHRISTPLQAGEDWRALDTEVGEIFADILESWRPDLVHFHAIQRLTASVVEATQAAAVPYVVTPHDAWWLSDWHFLVDDQGVVRLPDDLPSKSTPPGVTVSQSLERRRTLARALAGAQKVLAVSESFATLYRERGFDRTVALPNGLPRMTPAPRRPSPSGRVRLAHVGNVAKHKGFHLVKAALLQNAFANLELTVIDHAKSGGYLDRALWGATPVRTIGKLAQDHIQELYAETDVLLAPSIWPESFGLVAREALACGLWVVASDRGAMAQDVVAGVNGFVIDVFGLDGLIGALTAIDADPQRYLNSPPVPTRLRSADEQAFDVAAVYREVAYAPPSPPVRPAKAKAPLPHTFEITYVLEAHPDWASLPRTELYRRWLVRDFEAGVQGSQVDRLTQLGLAPTLYPEVFDWRRYLTREPQAGGDRWAALEHLLDVGIPAGADVPMTDFDTGFLLRLADRYRGRDEAITDRLTAQARSRDAPPTALSRVLGSAFYAQESWAAALSACEAAVAAGDADLWTFVHGTRAAIRERAFDRGFDLLAASRAQFGHDLRWVAVLTETIHAAFSAGERRGHALYVAGRRAKADAEMTATIDLIVARWRELAPKPVRIVADDAPVLILANLDLPQCTHYRIEQKLELLTALGRQARVFDMRAGIDPFLAALPSAGAVIAYRLPAEPAQICGLVSTQELGVPLFYDIDDLIFDPVFPAPLASYGAAVTPEAYIELQKGVPLARGALAICDFAITSTPALAALAEPLVRRRRAFVLPNGLDSRDSDLLDKAAGQHRSFEVVVFYGSGSHAHDHDVIELAGPALLQAFAHWPQVRLVIAGHATLGPGFDRFHDRITRLEWTRDIERYWSSLAQADINLAVLVPSKITDGKSEIKWLEAAALGVPSIVSDTARYREVVEDGVDGLIAATPDAWCEAIHGLIASPALRTEIGLAARRKAAANYSVAVNAERLEAILEAGEQDRSA